MESRIGHAQFISLGSPGSGKVDAEGEFCWNPSVLDSSVNYERPYFS